MMKRTALKMKNPPHPGLGVRVGCLEPYGLTITEGDKILGVTRQTRKTRTGICLENIIASRLPLHASRDFGSITILVE